MAYSTFDRANDVLDGRLEQVLREMRAGGGSYDTIAADFTAQGIPCSRESIRRWVKNLIDDDTVTEAVAS